MMVRIELKFDSDGIEVGKNVANQSSKRVDVRRDV